MTGEVFQKTLQSSEHKQCCPISKNYLSSNVQNAQDFISATGMWHSTVLNSTSTKVKSQWCINKL